MDAIVWTKSENVKLQASKIKAKFLKKLSSGSASNQVC